MTAPTVSVVMAAYNGAALIGDTLASLEAQSFTDFEVIVVDDGSTDATREVVRARADPRIRLIESETNTGPVRARNRAVAEARGRYVAGLDQDDLCRRDRLARQVAYLESHPRVVLVASAADILDRGAVRRSRLPANTTPALIGWLLQIMNPLVWSSVMLRGDVAHELAPFTRPEILYAEDFDLYHRLRRYGAIARIDDPLVTYRRHAGGASQRHAERMIASAQSVLDAAYAPLLGESGAEAARLVARHVMAGVPVGDRATLRQLGTLIAMLQASYLDSGGGLDRESVRLIRWETARLWWRIARHAVRSGALGLGDALAVRPDHLGLGHAGIDDLLLSALVGRARAARRRLTA